MTNEYMKLNGQACSKCGKYIGLAIGKERLCKGCKNFCESVLSKIKPVEIGCKGGCNVK